MRLPLALGLDLGGTKIAAGVVNTSGRLLSQVRLPTPASGVRKDLAALFDAAHSAVSSAGVAWKSVRAIGVGVPGAFDPVRKTVWAPNLPGWSKVPLERWLEGALGRPTFVEGDRNVQALAEAWLGSGKEQPVRNLVFLTVGTGIGAGLIVDGRVISGTRGVAGAAGWLAIREQWEPLYGRIGCLEALGAGPAVTRLMQKALRAKRKTPVSTLAAHRNAQITPELVVQAARHGDATAKRVLAEIGDNLGRGVAGIVSLLNPQVVVVGGGLAGAGELILAPLRRAARQWSQPLAMRQVRIVHSRLGEEAGVLGAARYAFLRMEE